MASYWFKTSTGQELKKLIKAFETLYGESKLSVRYGHFLDVDGQPIDISYDRDVVIRKGKAVIDLEDEGEAVLTLDWLARGSSELVLLSKRT